MKTRGELEEAIKDTINAYKEIIFASDISTCRTCLDKLRKQQAIDVMAMIMFMIVSYWIIVSVNLFGKDFKKILCWMKKQ